ncbi:MAG TPA: selenoneine biosynthesis selenosugar synthase SenB [Blastocatellia bacterium]|nr:selenoneine biosynthesis selenosugar synthase SenB [Blastocatellia bacterium]
MRIGIITPAPPGSRYGNRVTALRWAGFLKRSGHRVTIGQEYEGEPLDLLIALHARRSHRSITRFQRRRPGSPLVVALTGTDLYIDLKRSGRARESLDLATRIIVLQPKAREELRPEWRDKARVIFQSVAEQRKKSPEAARKASRSRRFFDVCVIGHLRAVKDPFRAGRAARLLPESSRIRVVHLGGAMSEEMARRARAEMETNPRYLWLGEQPPARVRRVLLRSRLCVLSSRLEGGANVVSEAVVAGTPVLSSRIAGSVGLLGEDYPGYFTTGDTTGLAELLRRAESDPCFLAELEERCESLAPLFDPALEEAAWAELIEELSKLFTPSGE